MEYLSELIAMILSPIYLLPAILGYIFYAITRDAKFINWEEYQSRRKYWGERWHEGHMDLRPFWENKSNHLFFLLPAYNILFLIYGIWLFRRSKKITERYNNSTTKINKANDAG